MNFSYAQTQQALEAIQGHAPAAYQAAFNGYLHYAVMGAHMDITAAWWLVGIGAVLAFVGIGAALDQSDWCFILIPAGACLIVAMILFVQGSMGLANAHAIALNDLLGALVPHGGGS